VRHVLLPTTDRRGATRRAARLVLGAALAAGLVACPLAPAAQAVVATATSTTTATLTPFATDTFNRTVTGGWATSTVGGAWTVAGSTTMYSVAPGAGKHKVASGQTAASYLGSVASADTDLRVDVTLDRAAGTGAGVMASMLARDVVGVGDYRSRLVVTTSGAVELRISRGSTTLKSVVTGLTYAAGSKMAVRTQVIGTSPTTIRAKVWKAGTTEPTAWQVSATDSTAGLQTKGRISLSTYQSGSTKAITASFSGLAATPTVAPVVTAPVVSAPVAPAPIVTSPVVQAPTATEEYPPFVVDQFARTVSGGWGTSVVGGIWKNLAGPTYSVAPGGGKQTVTNGQTAATWLGTSTTDADVSVDVAFNRPAGTGSAVYSSVVAREITGVGDYRARLVVLTSGGIELRLGKSSTTLKSTTATGVTYAPGTKMTLRTQVTGTNPTTLRAKVWKTGTTEPAAWQLSTTDATTGLQVAGRLNISTFATGNSTAVTGTYSSLEAVPAVPLAPNVPPTASFTATAKDYTATLDAAASADSDGSLVSYAWTHGDGTTSTGAQVSHTYLNAGTYTTTLKVTDDRGGSATTTKTVTVTGPIVDPAGRNPWLHPFASTSPWNTAIGSGATFESATGARTASLFTAKPVINRQEWSVATERATTSDPIATLTAVRNKTTYQIRIPRDTVTTAGLDKHVTVVQPDGVTAYDMFKMTKISDTQWTAEYVIVVDLRESGIFKGVRASGAPGFAGLIREHEVANKVIPHALAIAVPGEVLKQGFVWPANREDGDSATSYTGQVPMGTLFAIPSTVNVETMALSPEGKALARALQNYGAYVVDRSGMASLYCELSCDSAGTERMKTDFKVLFPQMRAVTNNTAATVGGGGTPRVAAPKAL
jgi:PKD repeat protein